MRLDEAKQILTENGYTLNERITETSLAKEIRKLLKTKYEFDNKKVNLYFDDIMPVSMPRPGSMTDLRGAEMYARRLCRDYFGW